MNFEEFKGAAIAVLKEKPLNGAEIARATGASLTSVYNWLKKLVLAGSVQKSDAGLYSVPVQLELTAPKTTVGQSPTRTYGKHKLLNKVVGRLTGASTKVSFLSFPFIYIDLCAGDGNPSYYSDWSSPQIIQHHADYLKKRMGEDSAVVILVEKDRATFDKLQKAFPANQHTYLINGDSKDPKVISQIAEIIKDKGKPSSPCFVHNDPNKVTDWAITEDLLKVLPRYTTSLTTMGCNVSGIKRLDLEAREKWFDYVQTLAEAVRSVKCHDAYLASLRNDKSQWAYLVTGPAKWEEEVVSDVRKAFKDWPYGVDGAWLSCSEQFDALIKSLFLTKKELAHVA